MANVQNSNMVVFLGGYDAEMLAIADACREAGVAVCDKHLGWGAAPSFFCVLFGHKKTPVFRYAQKSGVLLFNLIFLPHH